MTGMPIDPLFDQTAFRFYTEFYSWGGRPLAGLNANPEIFAGQQVRLRFLVTEAGHNVDPVWIQFNLEYRVDPAGGTSFGAWTAADSGEIYFDNVTSSKYANDTPTTQIIGAGTFDPGALTWVSTTAFSAQNTPYVSGAETEMSFAIKFGAFSAGARFEFRLTMNKDSLQQDVLAAFTPLDTYTQTPQVLALTGSAGVGNLRLPSLSAAGPYALIVPLRPTSVCITRLATATIAAGSSDRLVDFELPTRGADWWSAGTPNRITVPAGVNFVTINGNRKDANGYASGGMDTYLSLNGIQQDEVKSLSMYWNNAQHFFSGAVSPGDYFELHVYYNGNEWAVESAVSHWSFTGWEI